jgi:magnesium transporter
MQRIFNYDSIEFKGEQKVEKPVLRLFSFADGETSEIELNNIGELIYPLPKNHSVWLNISGLHDIKLLGELGQKFSIHPLIIEDIANTEHHPKIELFDDYFFMELKHIIFKESELEVDSEQISLLLGKGYVITFLEKESDIFDKVIDRIKSGVLPSNKHDASFLHYLLVDAVVDSYYKIIEQLDDDIELLEEELIEKPRQWLLHKIHKLRRAIIFLRKSIVPLREIIRKLDMLEHNYLGEKNRVYIKDLYDHTVHVVESLETMRETLSVYSDIYLSSASNRMNEIMKVLTIISTIFIPLTFIAGVYGMNFHFMPELEWVWGYPLILFVMTITGLSMILYFKRKKWF